MMLAAGLLFFGALGAAAAPAPPAPVQPEVRQWAARGFPLKDIVTHPVDGLPVVTAVYGAKNGTGDRLEIYVIVGSKAYLGYSHPARTDRLALDGSPAGRDYRDLLGDGSRIIAYHATIPGIDASSLELVRYKKFHFSRIASFPEGRFVQDDGQTLILARDLPLGRFLSVGCSDFGAISQTAFRTRLYAPSHDRFVEVTALHPALFTAEIRRKEAALNLLKGDLQKNAGQYLGLALSLYYDYAALDRAREGWERQQDFFQVPRHAPRAVKACFDAMRADLRGRLGIPSDWP